MQPNRFSMVFCSITLVMVPSIVRELFMQAKHEGISGGLGQNAGGCYGGKTAIAFHKTFVGNARISDETVAVDQQQFRFNG